MVGIIPRHDWGARPPRSIRRIPTPSRDLWLHHTAGNEAGIKGMQQIQNFHMDTKGWSDIAYSFVIDPDTLLIYEGRGAGIAGGHTAGHNTTSHAICVMGNFDKESARPELLRTIADLIRYGREHGWWGDLTGGHRDASGASTACPGRQLQSHLTEIRALSNATTPPTPPGDDDMTTPEEVQKIVDAEGHEIRQWTREEMKRQLAPIREALGLPPMPPA